FISYNRSADLQLSGDLQHALQRFAKPWYRLRALRIFRDVTVLSASPNAWAAVQRGLDESEFLILLASPQAAASPWVKRELSHWLSSKPHGKILIALTGGELVWDHQVGDFDWTLTTALPVDILQGRLSAEPSYVDLRAAKTQPGSRVFQALVADLAAPLHH